MINVEYTPTTEDAVKSTLDFLLNRPAMRLMFFAMKASCLFLCFGFVISMQNNGLRPQDYVALLFAVIWLIYYKQINKFIIKRAIKNKPLTNLANNFNIDKQRIFYKNLNNHPEHLPWNKVKFLLKTDNGYIIPLTGFSNIGKFLWLPRHGFADDNSMQEFTDLLKQLKIKIKKIK